MKRLRNIMAGMCLAVGLSVGNASYAADAPGAQPEEKETVDVKGILFGHVGDTYGWHITSWGDTHLTIPLPIIVRSETTGWHAFLSSRLEEEGSVYEGFSIATEGSPYEGKVIEHDAAGNEVRPLDISITKVTLALFINSLLLISCFIVDFLRIHPFEDGNGRMSRLLTALLLYQEGYDICRYVSLESRINASKDRYYGALEDSETGWFDNASDYTPFIEYFLGVLFLSYREYDRRLASAVGRSGKSAAVRDLVLNVNMPISKREIAAMLPDISESTVEAELRRMLDAGEIVKIGSTRGARYITAPQGNCLDCTGPGSDIRSEAP